ncbi:hypothetical protein HJC23_002940 [Cyclotella cryptica]|uniref:Uncharacterized protein n=1 Tax=Cyclotella cryptica TaxID=29204 RepID=A0ABD3PQD2_9STRA|eukprot:CCRYP_012448-RA/>CCRYP_012448-RA protein AED:0.07 eAED:0.07 QI:304/1/1/1/1/1/3/2944/226
MTIRQIRNALLLGTVCLTYSVTGFAPPTSRCCVVASYGRSLATLNAETTADATDVSTIQTDPKEAVKLFGRLAEKYIMLDASAGMCCYSGCTDCEFREPGGGYRMADQSSSRPKWIPVYDHRAFQSGKEHTSKWSSEIFTDGPAVSKEQFVSRVINMQFVPPLGGPYLAASAAAMEDEAAAASLFDILAGEKEKLTKHRMGKQMKELANGEEGLTWTHFSAAMGAK